jgi:prevent-host-death family protein
MKNIWQLEEAKKRFRQVVDKAVTHGPQTVTRHGKPVVMVVPATGTKRTKPQKRSILELFEPIRELELETSRDRSLPRMVKL